VEKSTKSTKPPRRKDANRAKIMNNPNPFIPQGSVLEQNKRRSRMKFAVGCVVIAGAAGLTAMLIQGCKREQPSENPPPQPMELTNPPPIEPTNPPPVEPTNPPPIVPIAPISSIVPAVGTEYTVVKGDTLAKIAKAHGVTLKALEEANPGVVPTKLKINQKLTLPAGSAATPTTPGVSTSLDNNGGGGAAGEIYTVKSGDTLTKIAKAHNTTVKLLEAENNLTSTKIKVNQKLKIPAKPEAAVPVTLPPAAPAALAPVTPPPAAMPGATSNP
jgi:LysM repeat protein